MSSPRPVHQLLAALSYGDAIGNEALEIRRRLRQAGFDSEIYAEHVHPRMAKEAKPLWDYERRATADSVCLYHFSIGSAAGRLAWHSPAPLVAIYHNITPPHFFLGFHSHLAGLTYHGRRELEAFAPRARLGLGDSEFNRLELAGAGFEHTAVLPIVMNLDGYSRRPSPVIRRMYGDGRTNLLFVGRVIPNKRLEDLIRVFAVYNRWLRPNSRLLLVGDYRGYERYHRRLLEMVQALGLEGRVVFTGHVDDDDLVAYYRVSHLFLCLSEHEGFCVPLVEAMHFGLPVIAYDAGAVKETLRGGGVLLKDKSCDSVAELVDLVLTDARLKQAVLGTQAHALAEVRAIDFGALLMDRLKPVLES